MAMPSQTIADTVGRCRARRVFLMATVLAALGLAPAGAAEVTRLGVASAMGDVLTVVVHRAEVGSRVDQNLYQSAANADPAFDDAARLVAIDGARRAGAHGGAHVRAARQGAAGRGAAPVAGHGAGH